MSSSERKEILIASGIPVGGQWQILMDSDNQYILKVDNGFGFKEKKRSESLSDIHEELARLCRFGRMWL